MLKERSKLYSQIRKTCLAAVKNAMKTLHYEASPPDVSFLCPVQSSVCSRMPHPAIVVESLNILKCSLKPHVSHPLTEKQKLWLPKTAGKKKYRNCVTILVLYLYNYVIMFIAIGFFGKLNPFKKKQASIKPVIGKLVRVIL